MFGGLLENCATITSFQILQKIAFLFRQEENSGFQKKSQTAPKSEIEKISNEKNGIRNINIFS